MPNNIILYKTNKGIYEIPKEKKEDFLKDFPNAVEVESFSIEDRVYDIPVGEVERFTKARPDAKPLKKKEISGEGFQLGSTAGTQLESPTEDKSGFRTVAKKGEKPDMEFEKQAPDIIDMQRSEQMLIERQEAEKQQRKQEEEIYKQIIEGEKAKVSSMIGEKSNTLNNLQAEINFNQTNLKELSRYNELNPGEIGVQEELTELSLKNDALQKQQEQESKNATYLKDAKYLINKTDKFLKSDRTGMSGWLDAVKNTALTKDFATLGISRITRNFNILEIAKKQRSGAELTPEENQALVAYGLLNEIRSNVDTGLGAVTGEAMVEMIPYLVSFAASGGTGKAVEGTMSGLLNVASRKGVGAIAAKTASFLAGSAARIPFFESLYSGVAERQIGDISVTPDMRAKTIEGTEESFKKALVKSIAATGSEVVTEQFGERLFPKVTRMFGKGELTQSIEKSVLDRVKSTIGFDGFVSEMGEELANKVFTVGLEGEPAGEIFNMKELMATALTVGTMSGAFQGVNLLTSKKVRSEVIESKSIAEGELDANTQNRIDNILNSEKNTDGKASDLMDFVNKVKNENATQEDIKNIIQYSQYKVAEDAMLETEEVIKEDKEKKKEETKNAISKQKAKPVPELEVRAQVGEKAPLRQLAEEPTGKEKKVETQPEKKTLEDVGKITEQPKKAGVEEVRDLYEQRGEEVPEGRGGMAETKTPERGIIFKDVVYEEESQIKESLDKGSITKPEHDQAVGMLNLKNFNDSKERLRSALDNYFTKQAVGDEKPSLSDVYNSIVDFIKNAIKMYGDKIKSARDVAKYAGVKYNKTLQDAYDEAIGKRRISDDYKMRGFPKRIKEFDEFKNIKLDIENNPELKYKPQNLKEVKEKIETMSDEELVSKMDDLSKFAALGDNDNIAVLSAIDLINRYRSEGKDVMPIIEKLSVAGTKIGQLIRQYAEIKGSTPEGFLSIIEKQVEKKDRFLTDDQKQKIKDLAEKDILNREELKKQSRITQKDFTDDNINRYNEIKKIVEDDYVKLAKYVQTVVPKDFWDMMGMTVQGNLLTPMSQITNIYANMWNIPLSLSSKSIASVMDYVYSGVTGKPRTVRIPLKTPYFGAKGFAKGTLESAKQIKTGIPSYEKADVVRGFQPIRSLVQAFTGEDMPVNRKGKIPKADRVKKIIEGTTGMPAETMFRLLNLGDKPFYRMSEIGTLYELAKDRGLKGKDLQKFMMFPDSKSAEIAKKSAQEATFQEESTTAKTATGITNSIYKTLGDIPAFGGFLKFTARTQMPYIRTPANIISQTLDFAVPPISFGKGLWYAYKGNRRDALLHMGKAATGVMIGMVAKTLLENNIVTGSPEEDRKKRNIQYDIMPPNSLNLSGLNRLINGEDPSPREGDEVINLTKMGIVGMVMGVHANVVRAEKKIGEKGGGLDEKSVQIIASLLEIPSYALEQSFLKGTSSLMQAINDKQWDYWLTNTFNAVSSIPFPNTLTAVNRAKNEYIYDLKGDNIKERLSNVIRNKLFMTDSLPIRRNLWGQKIKSTPSGENPWLYHLVDVTKEQRLEANPESRLVYDLYLKTKNPDVIPSVPSRNITFNNKTIELTSEEYEKFIERVGEKRLLLLRKKINNKEFEKLNNEQKIYLLNKIYDFGYEEGKIEIVKIKKE